GATVRERAAPRVRPAQSLEFTVLASPERLFATRVRYAAPMIDPTARRVMVRATIDNVGGLLKPEMFANVSIFTEEDELAPAVPREAILHEGNTARGWVAGSDKP